MICIDCKATLETWEEDLELCAECETTQIENCGYSVFNPHAGEEYYSEE